MRVSILLLSLAVLLSFGPACDSGDSEPAVGCSLAGIMVCNTDTPQQSVGTPEECAAIGGTWEPYEWNEQECATAGGVWTPPASASTGSGSAGGGTGDGSGNGTALPQCTPSCDGRNCGDDGCGASCGSCETGMSCNGSGMCVSADQCTDTCDGMDKVCGEVCGVSCGACPEGYTCAGHACVPPETDPELDCSNPDVDCSGGSDGCTPDCAGKNCGDDGCGGTCGTCAGGQVCDMADTCVAMSDCTDTCAGLGWSCGTVCGETCGTCGQAGDKCEAGACVCTASCIDKECGDDGCGGTCGTCPDGATCDWYSCEMPCEPSCTGKTCGSDGCGGTCGECAPGTICTADGSCQSTGGPDNPGGSGADCGTTLNCLVGCQDDACLQACGSDEACQQGCIDQACITTCQGAASPEALQSLNAFLTCFNTNCANDPTEACLAQFCAAEQAQCFGGGTGGGDTAPGTGTCMGIIGCQNGPPPCTTQQCFEACVATGTETAQQMFMALYQCIVATCDVTDAQCQQDAQGPGGACEGEVAACVSN